LSGVGKPVHSSEDDIDVAEGNADDVKYRKGADEVAQDDEATKPEIPRQKVTYSSTIAIFILYVKSFFMFDQEIYTVKCAVYSNCSDRHVVLNKKNEKTITLTQGHFFMSTLLKRKKYRGMS
jgi:hypothetical protein